MTELGTIIIVPSSFLINVFVRVKSLMIPFAMIVFTSLRIVIFCPIVNGLCDTIRIPGVNRDIKLVSIMYPTAADKPTIVMEIADMTWRMYRLMDRPVAMIP